MIAGAAESLVAAGHRLEPVARYGYRCRECGARFEVERPMAAADDPASCPEGHDDVVKLISSVAVGGRGGKAVSMGRDASLRAAAAEKKRPR